MLGSIHNLWQLGTNPEYCRIQTGIKHIGASVGYCTTLVNLCQKKLPM